MKNAGILWLHQCNESPRLQPRDERATLHSQEPGLGTRWVRAILPGDCHWRRCADLFRHDLKPAIAHGRRRRLARRHLPHHAALRRLDYAAPGRRQIPRQAAHDLLGGGGFLRRLRRLRLGGAHPDGALRGAALLADRAHGGMGILANGGAIRRAGAGKLRRPVPIHTVSHPGGDAGARRRSGSLGIPTLAGRR